MDLGEKDLKTLLKSLKPILNNGEYVFCSLPDLSKISSEEIVCLFRESEGITIIITKEFADKYELQYSYVARWITLEVHSSLSAVGLTATFAKVLMDENISCNVVAAFYHDHIFIDCKDSEKAMEILSKLNSN
ncbi:ACT domain-containing protein [Chryseobacterium scophthalmum]|uniref:ACT domain-containing protein n=1 Tax=Chryseobacterium scophthalmum TaxID=59733 RepID=UPI001AEC2203|nr:ACT domain-containing protein [Chryseobacterium scophthalmum]